MFLKKIITYSFLGLAIMGTTAAFAGGVETPPPPSFTGVYIEGNAGYAFRNWRNVIGTPFDLNFGDSTQGGFSAIVDLGYQFNELLSIELGWVHLPSSHGNELVITPDDLSGTNQGFTISSWAAYLAGKLTIPVYEGTYLFGKLGVAYAKNDASININPLAPDNFNVGDDANYWTPMFAFGIQYYFNPNLSVNLEYMRIPGYHHASANRFAVPASDIITLGLGYKFLT